MTSSANAQFKNGSQATELKLPTLSQRAIITQRIGLTDITINYCRPLVSGRTLFGKEIPYGQVWRAGANENTVISFTDDVSVEGHALPAGTYGLHMIPGADQWTIIFSKNSTSWGSFSYDEKEDALRVTTKPQPAEFEEALAYTFEDVKPDSTAVTLRWAKVAVPFHVSADVNAIVLRSIQNQLRSVGGFTWAGYDEAGTVAARHQYQSRSGDQVGRPVHSGGGALRQSADEIADSGGPGEEAGSAKRPRPRHSNWPAASNFTCMAEDCKSKINKTRGSQFSRSTSRSGRTNGTPTARSRGSPRRKATFDTAIKEMNLALASAPDSAKNQIQGLIDQLEKKQDINPR